METINDVFENLSKLEVAFCPSLKDHENLIRDKEILTNVLRNGNSEKLETILQNVSDIEILSGAGDLCEIPEVIEILRQDIKFLQIQMEQFEYIP